FVRPDRSSVRNPPLRPGAELALIPPAGCGGACGSGFPAPAQQPPRYALQALSSLVSQDRGGLRFHQPPSGLAALGVVAPAPGATPSKYVARRETPVYIPENCTQCMECITACPDAALPNPAQEVSTVLKTAADYYVTDASERAKLTAELKGV